MEELLAIASKVTDPVKPTPQCFIGFDGVTDQLLDVVDRWQEEGTYAAMATTEALGNRILEFAGKSCNIDVIPKVTKIGGNSPILARALVEGGHDILLVGTLGKDEIEPVFQPLAALCRRVVSLNESATTYALEFTDGKVMLGKLQVYKEITWENLLKRIPLEELIAIHEELDLFVSAGWSNVHGTNDIWKGVIEQVIPHLSARKRWMFVDLADPAKRSEAAVRTALRHLAKLSDGYSVVLGLNRSEARQIGALLGYAVDTVDRENMESVAQEILKRLPVAQVVLHAARFVALADAGGSYSVEVPHCATPKITTGAGDNFNGGFCNGLLRGLSPEGCLITGIATSGFYIRNGKSPSMQDLAKFLRMWHDHAL